MRHSFAALAVMLLALSCRTVDTPPPPSTFAGEQIGAMTSGDVYGSPGTTAPAPTTTGTTYQSTPQDTAAQATTPASTQKARLIHVGLNDYRIDIPDSLPSGPVTLHVMNYGRIPHSFGIRSSSATGYGTATSTTGTPTTEPSGYGTPTTPAMPAAASEYGAEAFDRRLPSDLMPGQSAVLEVDLQPGSYVTYCPVGDHASVHGMTRAVTVR